MKKVISILLSVLLVSACAQADKFSFDTSNPLALLAQISWSINAVPNTGSGTTNFVAVGEKCSSWNSSDGKTWTYSNTKFPGCTDGSISAIAYGNGTWVAVGALNANGGCGIWSSKDAETWTASSCASNPSPPNGTPALHPLYTIVYAGTRFFAGGPHNGSTTGVGFFGQVSSDGSSWQYLSLTDGSSYIGSDYLYSSSYNSVTSEVYFSGVHNVNSEVISVALPGLGQSSVSVSMISFSYGVLALKSGQVLVYGDDNYTSPTMGVVKIGNSITTVSSASSSNTGVTSHINIAAEGKDKIVILGNQCKIDYYQFGLNVWHPGIAAPAPTMTNCSGLDWTSMAYNSTLDLYVAGARVSGSTPTAFAYSTTGLPSAWTVVTQASAGTPGPAVLGIATK
ncbi:hypothetical protein EHQ05_11900 [Leptospira yasudae]|uniref:hypothetical protein n=1 Tax=Leptospira yasudae TaxID=2202201 RepID=UPI0010825083|nr:hypothetical protein [Leptospira yasudae]TGK25597.1 hypothetical protein EHQ05_11900 [Leptospira yasudae]TGM02696.1 hypothetical protein EHQ86_16615 [Leptospira yasudae]